MSSHPVSEQAMAIAITRAASRQTDLTIRYLVDAGLAGDAYRAYGYFRWVDDWLDQGMRSRQERLAFVARQENLMEAFYRGDAGGALALEETMLATLIAGDCEPNSGLQAYIRNMISVMAFDADRRGRLISQHELSEYTRLLAVAVTEALHHFIGHCCASPHDGMRYQAVTGAHITHMLRDALDDAETGYFNIPNELVSAHHITPWDVSAPAYRDWVRERVQKARECFRVGREYLARVANLRCRLAGYAYIHRFEVVLGSIERDGYLLRKQYPERREGLRTVAMIGSALWMTAKYNRVPSPSVSSIR